MLGALSNWPVIFLGILIILFSLTLIGSHLIIAIILIIVGLALTTGIHGFQIDPNKKVYRQYLFMLGFTMGKWHRYDAIEKIFINSMVESQTIYSRTNQSNTVKKHKLISFLKFDDGRKIELYEGKNKSSLLKKLNRVAQDLSTHIQDNTTN